MTTTTLPRTSSSGAEEGETKKQRHPASKKHAFSPELGRRTDSAWKPRDLGYPTFRAGFLQAVRALVPARMLSARRFARGLRSSPECEPCAIARKGVRRGRRVFEPSGDRIAATARAERPNYLERFQCKRRVYPLPILSCPLPRRCARRSTSSQAALNFGRGTRTNPRVIARLEDSEPAPSTITAAGVRRRWPP